VRRISLFALTSASLALLLCLIVACPKATQERSAISAAEATLERGSGPCPKGMAHIKKARICMDIFEYPNATGEVPLGGVKWEDAVKLCKKQGKRLPTAEEWEAACGGKKGRAYPYGDKYKAGVCTVDLKPRDKKTPYEAVPPGNNPECVTSQSVYDMSGNLWEWTSTPGFEKGTYYVKGGSWSSYSSVATCGLKAWEPPEGGGPDYGFRCVISTRDLR